MRRLPAVPDSPLLAPEPDAEGNHALAVTEPDRAQGRRRPCPEPGPAGAGHRWATVAGSGAAMRITGNRVSTAVRTLAHPRTARIVTLVGTMHIGETKYFEELSTLVEGLAAAGAEVHVEGISHSHHDYMRKWERNCLAAAESWAHPETTGAATSLGVESQGVRMRLPHDARNIDLSHIELLRGIGWDNYRRLFTSRTAEPSGGRAGPLVRAAIGFEIRHRRFLHRVRSLRRRYRRVNQVVLGERNRVAFGGAVEALNRSDVVLVWGADHLPGLARLFALQNYHLRHEQWFDACLV